MDIDLSIPNHHFHHDYWIMLYRRNRIIPVGKFNEVLRRARRHKDPNDIESLYNWKYLNELMGKYKEEKMHLPSDFVMPSEIPEVTKCANCRRANFDGSSEKHSIQFRKLRGGSIRGGQPRQYKMLKRVPNDEDKEYDVCVQCYTHLQHDENKVFNSRRYTWPAFIYSVLTSTDVNKHYGETIWKLIPFEWRKWWILDLVVTFPQVYKSIDLNNPIAIVRDATEARNEFTNGIDPRRNGKKAFSVLRDTVDKYLIPDVACPYGCSEFLHKGNGVAIDLIFQRYLQRVRLRVPGNLKLHASIGVRNDFLRWNDNLDVWLFNPKWKIIPSIVIGEDGEAIFLTCRHHKCTEGKHMIHTPRRPDHILPSPCHDQLAHLTIKPRTTNQGRIQFHSNSYQMFLQRPGFLGIDSCDVALHGVSNIASMINTENEIRAIMNRPDINALLTKLVEKKVLDEATVEMRRSYAEMMTTGKIYEEYFEASTYSPLQVCIDLHRKSNTNRVVVVRHATETTATEDRVVFPFLPHLYPCMVADDYGTMPLIIPSLAIRSSNPIVWFRLHLWNLYSVISQNESIWRALCSIDTFNTSEWVGWMLLAIEKHSIKFRPTPRLYHHTKHNYGTASALAKKLALCCGTREQCKLHHFFSGIDGIEVFCMPRDTPSSSLYLSNVSCNRDSTNVIIVEDFYPDYPVTDLPEFLSITVDDVEEDFCLRYVSDCSFINNKLVGNCYMRHGGNGIHNKWWHQGTKPHDLGKPVQRNAYELNDLEPSILVYVKVEAHDMKKLNADFLTYIGGQKNYCCGRHKLPLIISTRRKYKCQNDRCNKTEHYCCPEIGCATYICKDCVEKAPSDGTTYSRIIDCDNETVNPNGNTNGDRVNTDGEASASMNVFEETPEELYGPNDVDDGNDSVSSVDSNTSSDSELEEPFTSNRMSQESSNIVASDLDNFLTFDTSPDEMNEIEVGRSYTEDMNFLEDYMECDILTTHTGEAPFNVASDQFGSFQVSGHVLLNQCGSLMTRSLHEISGSSKHRNMLQSLCSAYVGDCIPLMQPEACLFPSIFWKMQPQEHMILGAIPAALLCEATSSFGFHALPSHVRTRLTVPFSCTSTDYAAAVFYHDTLANLCASRMDTRLIVDRGLTVDDNTQLGLKVRGGSSSAQNALLGSIDSSQWVLNLCASQRYHPFDFFITLTCNQAKHFGVRIIKQWIDGNEWTEHVHEDYDSLPQIEKDELRKAVTQAASSLILRNWQEVCQLIIHYLRTCPDSPFKDVDSIFARNEYQKEIGNLSHIHLMLKVRWEALIQAQREFVENLICGDLAAIVDIERGEELVESGLLDSLDDLKQVYEDAKSFLPHKCNLRCQRRIDESTTICKKENIGKSTPDNTKAHFLPLPSIVPDELLPRLERLGIMHREDNGEITFTHQYFNPTRHIPPVHLPEDFNISPVEAMLFVLCRSMQNVQIITGTGGCNKYVCKYIAKVDEQNYVVISTNQNIRDKLKVSAEFLHNTKISSSAKAENDLRKSKHSESKPQGRMISLNEMLHVMLKYPEVITDLQFTSIPSVPLEQRARLSLSAVDKISQRDIESRDGAYTEPDIYRARIDVIKDQEYRQMTPIELLQLNDLRMSRLSVDRITQFSLRPPELREVFDNPGIYFRWFTVDKKPISHSKLRTRITDDLSSTTFVDGFQRRVRLRLNAFEEVKAHLEKREREDDVTQGMSNIIALFRRMMDLFDSALLDEDEQVSADDSLFLTHARKEFIDETSTGHLPIPVFSYTRPTQGHKFLLHVLLSMGRYHTEAEVTTQPSLRECFRAAKLIGPSDDPAMLQKYSDDLFYRFLEEQLFYFSNSRRVLFDWMILVGDLFDSVIVNDEILVTDMPSVQMTSLLNSKLEELIEQRDKRKRCLIYAAFKELGAEVTQHMPTQEELINASKENPVVWDPIAAFKKSPNQSEESYAEQKLAIEVAVASIKKAQSLADSHRITKNIGIRGFPGGGKTFCALYVTMYAISQGLDCVATAMMASRATSLGGIHWHRLLGLPTQVSTPQRMAEQALAKIMRNPLWIAIIRSIDFILADELGQLSSEFVQAINIIFSKVRCNSNFFGGILILGTLDHTQIQPWKGRPFLSSPLIIPIFRMVKLTQSVRTQNASNYRIQQIARMKYSLITPEILDEFVSLCSSCFTFVDSWDDAAITKSTFRVYSKKVPVAEATKTFMRSVEEEFQNSQAILRTRHAIDTYRYIGNHVGWRVANTELSEKIDSKTKIPQQLFFFKGAVFECTYNDTVKETFNNTDPVLLYDVPSQDDLDNFRPIKVLKVPVGCKDFDFDMTRSKQFFLDNGFKEISISTCPKYIIKVSSFTQAQRKQYGLRHRITGTIHSSMGDTYESLASEVSSSNPDYGLWDKGMLVVLISRTRDPKKTIFVGPRNDTIRTLKSVLMKRTMWTDYVESILNLITVNETDPIAALTPDQFPFRIADMSLPSTNSGIVYMLNSLRDRTYTYIGKTKNPRVRLYNHNAGYGSAGTEPIHLRPFAVMAYIAGFDGDEELMLSVERRWQEHRDILMSQGVFDPRVWARAGTDVIKEYKERLDNSIDLRMVLLFYEA